MTVTADETRIVADGAALARAAYPVTVDPEVGANDSRTSDVGSDLKYDAGYPAVAYNSVHNEYLVVWSGDDSVGGLVDDEQEPDGKCIGAATGTEVGGNDLRISAMRPDGEPLHDALHPAAT